MAHDFAPATQTRWIWLFRSRTSYPPSGAPRLSRSGILPNHEDRAVGVADYGVRDAAHKGTTQSAPSTAPDYDKVGIQLLGQLEDLNVREAHP
jgi:hypothetical protein